MKSLLALLAACAAFVLACIGALYPSSQKFLGLVMLALAALAVWMVIRR